MNKKTVATIGIIGGLAVMGYSIYYYFKRQTDLIKNFTYKVIGINFSTFNIGLVKGDLTVAFTNTSNIEVLITEFYVDFYFNEQYVGYLEDKTPFVIKSMQTTPVTTQFTLNPQLILGDLVNIIAFSSQYEDAKMEIVGKAKVKSGFISATINIDFSSTIKELLK